MARKYARIFVRGHYLFRKANSFPRAELEENCELQLFTEVEVNSSWLITYELANQRAQKVLFTIRSRDALRPIAHERKYLMDYNCLLFQYISLFCFVTSDHGLRQTAVATSVLRDVWAFLPLEKQSIKGQFITGCRKSRLRSSQSLCFSLLFWDKPLNISHMCSVVKTICM